MKPEKISRLIGRWVRLYTRNLPLDVAQRRIGEIDADLHDQIAHERAEGRSERRIALGVLSRTLRGLAADASWRRTAGARPGTARRSIRRVSLVTALVLSVPLVAMRFTDEVAWTPADFVVAGLLLGGTGMVLELIARRARNRTYKAAAAVGLGAAFVLVWLIGAVGVIGSDGDPADLMYAGVIAIGVAGAIGTHLRPRPMARVLLAMAAAQALVAAVALIAGRHEAPTSSVAEIVVLNGIFIALFAGSAWLFQRAENPRGPGEIDDIHRSRHP